jgi:reactive chlorine resistance protein C
MTTHTSAAPTIEPSTHRADRLALPLSQVGNAVLRYGLVFLLLLWGSFKFMAFEAEAIRPLLEESPFFAWTLHAFGVRGASALIGVVEVATALAIAARRLSPRLSAYGSMAAAFTFLATLSFLVTTPGVLALDNPWGGFLMKDLILLGGALATAAEALAAAKRAHG